MRRVYSRWCIFALVERAEQKKVIVLLGTIAWFDMKRRIQRVLRESGALGAAVRLSARLPRQSGEWIAKLSDRLLKHIPMSVLTPGRERSRLALNVSLSGRHRGERCFIMATGPSLRDQDLSGLEREVVFSVNQGFYFARQRGIAPTYHCMVDSLFLESRFDGLHTELAAFLKEVSARLLTTIEIADHWHRLGIDAETFPVRQVLNSRPWDEADLEVSVDPTQAVPGFVSVVHAALSWAIYMGFAEIYLLGCDMDYFISPQQTYKRSYEDERYLSNREKTSDLFGLHQVGLIEWILVEFRAFANLKRVAESHGSRILNAGEGGALNVFPRVELSTVLGMSKCSTNFRTDPC